MTEDWTVPETVAQLDASHEPASVPFPWPVGTTVGYVRDEAAAGCATCRALCDALADHRQGVSIDGQHHTIEAFATDGGTDE